MLILVPNYIPESFNDFSSAEDLWQTLPWDERTDARKECFFNRKGTDYTYGEGRGERTYTPVRDFPEPAWLKDCWASIQKQYNNPYAACFINGYEHHRQHLGWHADDSDMIDHDYPIVVVSFGAEREIWTKAIGTDDVTKWPLGNGSIFVMPAGFQQTHLHRIPKHFAECGKRISLTFRALK